MMNYGQVYQTDSGTIPADGSEEFPYGMAFRGIVYDDEGKEGWYGRRHPTPVDALVDMKANAGAVTDLRPWSGALPAKPLWTPDEDSAA